MPAQITFTTDLIYLFNLPTILIYQLLAFLYSKIIATIVWIMPLLFIKR